LSIGLAKSQDIVGKWKTIDDETKKAKSVVEIYKGKDGLYYGKIIKLFPAPGEDPNPKCTECSGDLYNKPVIGMEIIKKMKKVDKNTWDDGTILDPGNGNKYDCKMSIEKGKSFSSWIYGLECFGRTQTWLPYTE
jgi:uncharacterized protein (DUF2147 family)